MQNIFFLFQVPIRQTYINPFVDIKQLSGFITASGINNVINQL